MDTSNAAYRRERAHVTQHRTQVAVHVGCGWRIPTSVHTALPTMAVLRQSYCRVHPGKYFKSFSNSGPHALFAWQLQADHCSANCRLCTGKSEKLQLQQGELQRMQMTGRFVSVWVATFIVLPQLPPRPLTFSKVMCLVSFSLAVHQRGAGAFAKLQETLVRVLTDDRLHIVRSSPEAVPKEATEYRAALLDLCLPVQTLGLDQCTFRKGALAINEQRLNYEATFTGDIRDRRVWHHVSPQDPATDEEIKAKLQRRGVAALMPCLLQVFPRHRWTGSQRVFRSMSLVACTHNLLQDTLLLWLSGDIPRPRQTATVEAPDDTGYHSDGEDADTGPNEAELEAALERQTQAAAAMATASEYAKVKTKVASWAATTPMAHLVLLCASSAPTHALMSEVALPCWRRLGCEARSRQTARASKKIPHSGGSFGDSRNE